MEQPRADQWQEAHESPLVLFRAEAVEASRSRFGSPVRPMGVAGWLLTAFMFSLFVVVCVLLTTGRYARKETVPGILQPVAGASRVVALSPGMVTEVHVADGDAIAAGSPVATVSRDAAVNGAGSRTVSLSDLMTEASDREEEALARSRAAQMEVQDRAREEVDAKRQGFRRESALLRANLELQSERVKLATATVEAARTLHQRELLSTLSLRQREEALIAARQSEHMLLLEVAKVESNLSQLEAEERRILASERQVTADAAIEGAKLQGRRAGLSADKAIVLTAQKSGRVAALQARPGIPVQAGSTLAIILPDRSRLQAELWVPSRAVGFVTVGTAVRLMYDAFPYQKFGVGKGRVVSVARAPTEPGELPIANDGREALYKVVVALENDGMGAYGQRWSLAPGMRLTADLLSENRSFWEWVFEPIIAATKRNSSS